LVTRCPELELFEICFLFFVFCFLFFGILKLANCLLPVAYCELIIAPVQTHLHHPPTNSKTSPEIREGLYQLLIEKNA
jgi:hypothetical protein